MMSRVEPKEMNGFNGLNDATGLEPAQGEYKKQNAWAGPGDAAFDFRSEWLSHFFLPIRLFLVFCKPTFDPSPP
jgi:hypothetical protein